MIFEKLLQNFIANFEEQEKINEQLKKKKTRRVFIEWKKRSLSEVKRIVHEVPQASKPKPEAAPSALKPPADDQYALHPELEQGYMELVNEFRKVVSSDQLKVYPKVFTAWKLARA